MRCVVLLADLGCCMHSFQCAQVDYCNRRFTHTAIYTYQTTTEFSIARKVTTNSCYYTVGHVSQVRHHALSPRGI